MIHWPPTWLVYVWNRLRYRLRRDRYADELAEESPSTAAGKRQLAVERQEFASIAVAIWKVLDMA
ncbi:MAG: hypothetical protein JSU00_16405 [Acidobacteria bacterium]|nr:hypothetical protein [Acidobacteriota bacterium]